MSESLVKVDVAQQIQALALLAGDNAKCTDFQHHILNSNKTFAAPGFASVFTLTIPFNSAFIITAIDVKMLYDLADVTFTGADFRSTFDLNPYGPLAVGAGVGSVSIFSDNEPVFPAANDIGIINAGLIFVFQGGHTVTVFLNPQQPAGKTLVAVTRIIGYLVPESIGSALKKKESRIKSGVTLTL
jgi:hypothetical protein